MNYQAICRVCTGENSRMVSIFEPYNFLANNCEIFKVIRDCASVQIQKFDGFSEQICPRCLDHLYQAYSFKKLCEDSDYKFRNDLIVSDKIEIKNEFSEEDAKILFEEIDNNITENISESSNVSEFRLTKIYSEQLEINPENKSEYDVNGIKQEELDSPCIFNDVIESVAYEEPFDLKNLQYIQDNTKEQYNDEIKTNNNSNMEQIETEEADDSTPYSVAFKSEDHKKLSGLTNLYPENYKPSKSTYKCALCSKTVTSKRTLALHMKVHTRQQHKCNICSNEFVRTTDLRHHMKMHLDEKPDDLKSVLHSLKSDIWNKTLNYASMKQIKPEICHIGLPTEEKPYVCCICAKSFKTKGHLKTHNNTHTEQRQYICNICSKTFKTNETLKVHIKTHTGEKQYMCNICGKKYMTKGILTTHIKSHSGEKPHECEHCEKKFLHKGDLKRHILLHTGENTYKCDICDKTFSRKGNLAVHLKWHTGQRPYKCDICYETFAYKCSLVTHTRIHTGEKRYACDICHTNFNHKCNLVVHRRSHTGEMPYMCDICPNKFKSSSALKKHIMMHTGEKRFECNFCNKKFSRRNRLVQHISSHMKEDQSKILVLNKII